MRPGRRGRTLHEGSEERVKRLRDLKPRPNNRIEGPFAGCPSHTAWPRDWASSNMPFGIRRFSNMNEGCYLISSREDSLLRRKKSIG